MVSAWDKILPGRLPGLKRTEFFSGSFLYIIHVLYILYVLYVLLYSVLHILYLHPKTLFFKNKIGKYNAMTDHPMAYCRHAANIIVKSTNGIVTFLLQQSCCTHMLLLVRYGCVYIFLRLFFCHIRELYTYLSKSILR